MRRDTLQRHIWPADHRKHDRTSQPERVEDHTGEPLNPPVAWSIVLFASVALWAGLGFAVSSYRPCCEKVMHPASYYRERADKRAPRGSANVSSGLGQCPSPAMLAPCVAACALTLP